MPRKTRSYGYDTRNQVFKFRIMRFFQDDGTLSRSVPNDVHERIHKGYIKYYNDFRNALAQGNKTFGLSMREACPELVRLEAEHAKIEAEIAELYDAVKKSRSSSRGRDELSDEHKRKLSDLRARKPPIFKRIKEIKAAFRKREDVYTAAIDAAAEKQKILAQRAKADSFLNDQIRELVVDAAKQSNEAAFRPEEFPERRFGDSYRIGQRTRPDQNTLTVSRLLNGADIRVSVDAPEFEKHEDGTIGRPVGNKWATFSIRYEVGKKGEAHKYLRGKMAMHRHIPTEVYVGGVPKPTIVTSVRVKFEQEHGVWQAYFYVNVDVPVGDRLKAPADACFVRPEYGRETGPDGRVRVATLIDSTGETGVFMPKVAFQVKEEKIAGLVKHGKTRFVSPSGKVQFKFDAVERLEFADDIRSEISTCLDAAKETLLLYVKEAADLPDWFREEGIKLANPKAGGKFLSGLLRRWKEARFPGDEVQFNALGVWKDRNDHLLRYSRGVEMGAVRSRNEFYRVFAASLSKKYGHVTILGKNYAEEAARPDVDDDDGWKQGVSRLRQRVARSELKGALENHFKRVYGPDSVKVTSASDVSFDAVTARAA